MTLDIQVKLKNNPLYKKYLRENSNWYKILTRNPQNFKKFEEDVRTYYQLRPTDRINKMLELVDLASSLMSALK